MTCGEDFIIGFKYNEYENLPNGIDPSLACRIGSHMEKVGVDYLHVASLGGPIQIGDNPKYPAVPSLYTLEHNPLLELANRVKTAVTVPVIAAGGFNRPEDAEAALGRKAADPIAVGRAFLADPNWGYYAKRGRPEKIRPCIKCNQCHIVLTKAHLTRCAINPALGEMDERNVGRVHRPKNMVVVGSGLGGDANGCHRITERTSSHSVRERFGSLG
jgi:2,4-dienoyl-CoA reductase-like NADH-dependent reductase (Old Yellow Enzyme family)